MNGLVKLISVENFTLSIDMLNEICIGKCRRLGLFLLFWVLRKQKDKSIIVGCQESVDIVFLRDGEFYILAFQHYLPLIDLIILISITNIIVQIISIKILKDNIKTHLLPTHKRPSNNRHLFSTESKYLRLDCIIW